MSEMAIVASAVAKTERLAAPVEPAGTGTTDRGITILATAGVTAMAGLGWC